MSRAYVLIRSTLIKRFDAFVSGLKALGFEVITREPPNVKPGDVLVTWNKRGADERIADRVEKQGGTVIVAENGYIGTHPVDGKYYALAKHGHNGSGTWNVGEHDRFADLGVELKPWRESGDHVLVCGQRGIGSRLMASPPEWHDKMAARLARITKRRIVVRQHPGRVPDPRQPTLDAQLENAWAVVVWSSSSGVKALAAGIPVLYDAPHFICAEASSRDVSLIESPPMPDRLPSFRRMAWAQWRISEIASGEAFKCLLS